MLLPLQIELLETLKKLWETRAEERFFQCLFNYSRLQSGHIDGKVDDPFFYSDEEILEDLKINLRVDKVI